MWVPTLTSISKAASGQHSDCSAHFHLPSYSILLSLYIPRTKLFTYSAVFLVWLFCVCTRAMAYMSRWEDKPRNQVSPSIWVQGIEFRWPVHALTHWTILLALNCVFQDYIHQFLFCLFSQRYIIILVYWHHLGTLVASFGYKSSIEFPTQANEVTWSLPFLHSS